MLTKRQHFAVSLHKAAEEAPTPIVSTYFELDDDNSCILAFCCTFKDLKSYWYPGGVNTLGRYKQISGRTISEPVCQSDSPTSHQWSNNCCVMLQLCKRQVWLPLKETLLHTPARQQQLVFTLAKFVLTIIQG